MSNQAPKGFFSGANNIDPSSSLPFFPPNFSGRVRINRCKGIMPLKGGQAFIAEVTVLTSNLPETVFVGAKHSWYQSIGGKFVDTAYASCVAFLYAALGLVPGRDQAAINDIRPQQDMHLNNIVADNNPLEGCEVILQTSSKAKKNGEPFTLHVWSAVPAASSAAA